MEAAPLTHRGCRARLPASLGAGPSPHIWAPAGFGASGLLPLLDTYHTGEGSPMGPVLLRPAPASPRGSWGRPSRGPSLYLPSVLHTRTLDLSPMQLPSLHVDLAWHPALALSCGQLPPWTLLSPLSLSWPLSATTASSCAITPQQMSSLGLGGTLCPVVSFLVSPLSSQETLGPTGVFRNHLRGKQGVRERWGPSRALGPGAQEVCAGCGGVTVCISPGSRPGHHTA